MAAPRVAKKMAEVVFVPPILITKRRMTALRKGHKATDMDDRWHAVFHDVDDANATLSFHRSWTGHEIYRAFIQKDDDGNYELYKFAYNTDKSEFKPQDTSDLADRMIELLDSIFPSRRASSK